MSRSGYIDDCDTNEWTIICWRGAVASAIKGRRGQAFLREMLEALDAMPEKKLIADDLVRDGNYCAIGVVGAKRGVDLYALEPEEPDGIAAAFKVSKALVCEIEFVNDEYHYSSEEDRWRKVREWVVKQLRKAE